MRYKVVDLSRFQFHNRKINFILPRLKFRLNVIYDSLCKNTCQPYIQNRVRLKKA